MSVCGCEQASWSLGAVQIMLTYLYTLDLFNDPAVAQTVVNRMKG